MAIVTSNYHPKRASKKIRPRTHPADIPLIEIARRGYTARE